MSATTYSEARDMAGDALGKGGMECGPAVVAFSAGQQAAV